ncbi:MAG TPA: AAA family ATPase [Verrucomicrobiae bacterium]|jgi:dephospho-CoA kinase|nr:AAA family ATPase [Verrucomicrobiae bacterium]
MKIIGLCGQPASGKDTAADFFVSKGFAHVSLGDTLRAEMRKQGLATDRAHMSVFAADAKRTRGMSYLGELAANQVSGNTVISGIRGTAEVEFFRRRFGPDFTLLAIDAPLETRYARARARNRTGDDISFEEFRRIEDYERSAASGAQEVDKVIALADCTVDNSGSVEELWEKLGEFCKG